MSVYKVETSIQGVFTNMDLRLDGKEIFLSYDGNQTYASTDLFNLSSTLVLQWIGVGLSFQDWTITLLFRAQKVDGSFDDPKKWTKSGSIPQGGGSQLYELIDPTQLGSSK